MIPPEGIRFRPPSENHAAPLGPKPSATPPAEQGFTDRALDAYTLQELLDLRARIERRLPARSLKDLDLESELVLQARALQQLQNSVIGDESTAANQKAQVANSLSAALVNLVKVQNEVYSTERVKRLEAVMISTLNALPQEAADKFLAEYDAAVVREFAPTVDGEAG